MLPLYVNELSIGIDAFIIYLLVICTDNIKRGAEQLTCSEVAFPLLLSNLQGYCKASKEEDMWVERLARLGYTAKGIVYAIIGVLAVKAALGTGGKTTDQKGALGEIATQPFGKFLLVLMALGLIGYVIWRFVEAVQDPRTQR
jgi:hypothetical protein